MIYVSKHKIHLKIIQSINIKSIKLSCQHTLSLFIVVKKYLNHYLECVVLDGRSSENLRDIAWHLILIHSL